MFDRVIVNKIQPTAFLSGVATALVGLSLSVSAASILPIPLSKPFMGPVPLEKPEYVDVTTNSSTGPDPRAVEFVCRRIGNKLASVTVADCLTSNFSSSGSSALGTRYCPKSTAMIR